MTVDHLPAVVVAAVAAVAAVAVVGVLVVIPSKRVVDVPLDAQPPSSLIQNHFKLNTKTCAGTVATSPVVVLVVLVAVVGLLHETPLHMLVVEGLLLLLLPAEANRNNRPKLNPFIWILNTKETILLLPLLIIIILIIICLHPPLPPLLHLQSP